MNFTIFQSERDANLYCAEVKTGGMVNSNTEPIHVALLLDVSGSMKGERITTLKASIKAFILCLKPTDRLTIITYAQSAQLLCTAKYIGENVDELFRLVDGLRAEGNTNMAAAFTLLAANLSTTTPQAMILLTDGHVNVGPSSSKSITLPLESDHYLQSIPIYTLGLGDDHNQIMLRDIALSSQGNYFYIDKSEDLPQTFGSILGILRDRFIEEINIGVPSGYSWLERCAVGNPDNSQIFLAYLPSGVTHRFVFRKSNPLIKDAPYLSIQYVAKPCEAVSIFTISTHNSVNRIADIEMTRIEVKEVMNQATNLLSAHKIQEAIELLEALSSKIENDKLLNTVTGNDTIMGLRALLYDVQASLRKQLQGADTAASLIGHMTSMTTTLSTQQSSGRGSNIINDLYSTPIMREQTQNVREQYDSIRSAS
jgi:hypothetical protein